MTGQCLRAGLLFAGFTAGLLFALAEPLTAILYQSEQAGRLLRVFAPLALVLYMDALTDGMLKGLSEQVANVRYNTLTSALDAVLLVLLLPRWGLGGYIFAFAATHLLNFTLSLRRLLIVTGCRASTGRGIGRQDLRRERGARLRRSCCRSWKAIRRGCCSARRSFPVCLFWLRVVSGTAERCLPPSLRGCCICRNAAKKRRRFVDFCTEKSVQSEQNLKQGRAFP
ncbi:MAG: polysaccharide biosynthesis C-terminal domain-containing protein [Acutalibacteraceae bacterium]